MATDVEAVVYMMLMNEMLHSLFPTAITVGEDVSGMPTLCRSALPGSIDLRLNCRSLSAASPKALQS